MHAKALAAALAILLAATAAGRADDETADLAAKHLERAVTPQPESRHVPLLTALRQLRDPAMQPLFYQLVQSQDPLIQVQAVLGAAELAEEPAIDPWLVTQIDPSVHDLLVTEALDQEILPDAGVDALLRWDGLWPMARLVLWAERLHRSPEPAEAELRAAAERAELQKDVRAFGLAASLLAERGDGAALDRYRDVLGSLGPTPKRNELRWILEALRQYRLERSLVLVDDALAAAGPADLDLVSAALLAALAIEPSAGLGRWRRVLSEDDGYARRVRLGLILLASGADVPASAYDAIGADEPLVAAIAAVGRALRSGRDPTDQLVALIDLGHGPSTDWATQQLEKLPQDQARRLALHLVQAVPAEPSGAQMTSAVRGASYLAQHAPDVAIGRLAAAADDGIEQQVLMLGLMETRGPQVAAAAAAVPRSGPGRADSTALVLLARNSEGLGGDDLRQLGVVAAGGGRVGEMLQVQAAWMYLKYTGRLDATLARVTVH